MPPSDNRLADRLLRRWSLTLLGVIITGGLCFLATAVVPITYQAKATILLTPPLNGAGQATNPYFSLPGLQPLAAVVGRLVTTSATTAQLHKEGFTGTYTVAPDPTSDGPILIATVDGKSAHAVLQDLRLVLKLAAPALSELQAGNSVPARDQVTIQVLTRPTAASRVLKPQIRALIVAGAAGLIGTALVVSAVDGLLLSRRRRTRHTPQSFGAGLPRRPAHQAIGGIAATANADAVDVLPEEAPAPTTVTAEWPSFVEDPTVPDVQPDPEPVTEPVTVAEIEPQAETETETEPQTEPEPEPEPEPRSTGLRHYTGLGYGPTDSDRYAAADIADLAEHREHRLAQQAGARWQ